MAVVGNVEQGDSDEEDPPRPVHLIPPLHTICAVKNRLTLLIKELYTSKGSFTLLPKLFTPRGSNLSFQIGLYLKCRVLLIGIKKVVISSLFLTNL